jgi:hypothetical protein
MKGGEHSHLLPKSALLQAVQTYANLPDNVQTSARCCSQSHLSLITTAYKRTNSLRKSMRTTSEAIDKMSKGKL